MPLRRTDYYQCMTLAISLFYFVELSYKLFVREVHYFTILMLFQIHKRPGNGSHRRIGMRTQNQVLVRKCEVTAILVLYGLPR